MAKKFETIIRGGLLVSGSGIRKADLGIQGEKIISIQPTLPDEEAGRVVDAAGKYVFPGIIDVHVHPVYEDNIGGLSFAAAHGGTTFLIHFAYARPGMKLVDTIRSYKEDGLKNSYSDFSIHGTIFDAAAQVPEIPKAFELGVRSFKMFMTYAKLKWMTDDYHLTWAMDLIAENGGLAMVHAESGLVTDYIEDKSLRRKEDQKEVFVKTRPDYLEAEAVFRAISIAAVMQCPLYIAHLSSGKGVLPIQRAREEGQWVYAETCPQYLSLTDEILQRTGPLAKIGPPLRYERDRMALWQAIQNGTIDTIASDHAPKAKKRTDPFFEAPFGAPSAETMLTVAYDEGVNTGRIGVCKLVQLLSENPAKIFGLFPQKGILQEGADADLVLFDPRFFHTIEHRTQHSGAPYTLYEGRKCLGKPVFIMQRGKTVVEDGQMKKKPGEAHFYPTRIDKIKLG
ncbi:MAG: amidohydrolase family protein [Syntrophaceae bacterium]|nr:amidohydrolase family protein [Syntrophaceae bacterium]